MTAAGTERANELYWRSERSVNQIADDLDLSKGALYAMIAPLAAGVGCPLCGSEVVYPNRTAKERDRLDCPTCDWDGSADETTSHEEGGGDDAESFLAPPPPASVTTARRRTMAGGALLGAAVGLALVIWARRR